MDYTNDHHSHENCFYLIFYLFMYDIVQYLFLRFCSTYIQYQKEILIAVIMKSEVQREQDYQCGICLMTLDRPVRCRGPCKKLFCFKCAVNTINGNKHCPNRCSSPFTIQAIPESNQIFRCPFNSQMCTFPITSRTQMLNHSSICQFVSPQNKQELYQQQTFSCKCGHQLCFLDQKGLEAIYGIDYPILAFKETCNKCKKNDLCRSLCLICSTRTQRIVYCSQCRPIPFTKTLCPMGHNLKRKNRVSKKRVCDLCDSPAHMVGQNAYGPCPCDFDVCEICQSQAPNENPIVPLPNKLTHFYKVAIIEDIDEESEWIDNSGSEYRN